MTNKLKSTVESVGLNYKKELTKITFINIIFILAVGAGYFFIKEMMVIIIGVFLLLVANYVLLSSYSSKRKSLDKKHAEEFVYVISYFRIFIANHNNVYQSFNKLIDYSSEWMKEQIIALLKGIDEDKSIKPFTDFAEKFDLPIAKNIIACIYQMVDQGETSEQLNQFVVLFEQMSKTLLDEKREKKLKSFDMVSFFPVVGAGIVILALTFSMLSLVGDMVNVI